MPMLTRSGWFKVEHRVGCGGRLFRVRRRSDAELAAILEARAALRSSELFYGDEVDGSSRLRRRYKVEMEVRRHGAERWEWVAYTSCADEAIRLYRAQFGEEGEEEE